MVSGPASAAGPRSVSDPCRRTPGWAWIPSSPQQVPRLRTGLPSGPRRLRRSLRTTRPRASRPGRAWMWIRPWCSRPRCPRPRAMCRPSSGGGAAPGRRSDHGPPGARRRAASDRDGGYAPVPTTGRAPHCRQQDRGMRLRDAGAPDVRRTAPRILPQAHFGSDQTLPHLQLHVADRGVLRQREKVEAGHRPRVGVLPDLRDDGVRDRSGHLHAYIGSFEKQRRIAPVRRDRHGTRSVLVREGAPLSRRRRGSSASQGSKDGDHDRGCEPPGGAERHGGPPWSGPFLHAGRTGEGLAEFRREHVRVTPDRGRPRPGNFRVAGAVSPRERRMSTIVRPRGMLSRMNGGTKARPGETVDRRTPAPGSETDEMPLVERARRGDREAFDLLVERHLQHVWAVVWRILRHHEDTEDVVQEVFLVAFQALPRYRGESRLSTWLHRIAVTRALNHLDRKEEKMRRALRSVEDVTDRLETGADGPSAWVLRETPSPLQALEADELVRHLSSCLSRLPSA